MWFLPGRARSPAAAQQQLSQGGQGIIGFALPAWKSTTGEVKSPAEVQEPVNTRPELALRVTRLLIPFCSHDPAAPRSSGNIYVEPSVGQALRYMWGVSGSLALFMPGQNLLLLWTHEVLRWYRFGVHQLAT